MSTAFLNAVRRLLDAERALVDDYVDLVNRAPTLAQRACLMRAESLQRAQIRGLRWVLGEIAGECPLRRIRARVRFRVIIREAPFEEARVIREVPAGTGLVVVREEDGWARVRLSDGVEGFTRIEGLEMEPE